MTRRQLDAFATAALAGLLAGNDAHFYVSDPLVESEAIATAAYEIAEAMVEESRRRDSTADVDRAARYAG